MPIERPVTITRSKNLALGTVDDERFAFESTLEDVSMAATPDGEREVIHRILIRGTVHAKSFELGDVEAEFQVKPYDMCAFTTQLVPRLSGLRLGGGYRRAVIDLMGGTRGCSHFLSLALELSQLHTLVTYKKMRRIAPELSLADPRWIQAGLRVEPSLEGACFTLATDSPVVRAAKDLRD